MKKILLLALFLVPSFAYGESHSADDNSQATSKWFGEVRYTNAFSAEGELKDPDTSGDGVVSTPGSGMEGSSSWGISVGRKVGNNTSITFSYEKSDVDYNIGKAVRRDGSVFDYINDVSVDMQVYIAEVEYKKPITEKSSWMVFAGLGQSNFELKNDNLKGSMSGTAFTDGVPKKSSDTVSRFGLGGAYKISDNVELIGTLQRTNYGEVSWIGDDGPPGLEFKMEATEAGLRLRFAF